MNAPEEVAPVLFRRWLTVIVAINLLTRLPFLGSVTLWNIDEGRIAEVSREMAVTGDYVVPKIGGETFASYPPLLYWMNALSGSLFGFNEFAMRLPGTLAGAALIVVVAFMARRLAGGLAGLLSAAVLATLPGFTSQQVICRGDVMMTLFSTIAFDRFLAFVEGDRRARHLAVLYGALGLAILSKGPLGVILPSLGVAVWIIVRRRWREILSLKPWIGLPAMLALALPWYVAVHRAAGWEFTRYNLMLENVHAFTSGFEHPRPPWSIAAWAAYRLVPWLLVLPFAWRVRRTPGFLLTLGWAAAIFALLTISSSKRPNYITYLCPAFAASVGIALAALCREAPALAGRFATLVGGILAVFGLGALVIPISWKGSFLAIKELLRPAFQGMIVSGASILTVNRWKGPVPGIAVMVAVLAVGVALQGAFVEPRLDDEGRKSVAFCRQINALLAGGEPLYNPSRRELEGAYHFYLGRIVTHRSGGPGYYLGLEEDALRFPPEKTRGLHALVDDRGRRRSFFAVLP